MLKKIARLFVIKTRFEAYAIIYAIAVGAVGRGFHYMEIYPGVIGYVFFAACTGAVFMAGAKILDSVAPRRKQGEDRRVMPDRRAGAAPADDRRNLANFTNA
jgi:hypothetical protein